MQCSELEGAIMKNNILSASNYQHSSTFCNHELECVLCECIGIYNTISSTERLPNDEELIRDAFLRYLKNDDYKNQHSPLDEFHFEKEVEDGLGRLDIQILPINPYRGDKAFYSIECKRLDSKNVSGATGLNSEYIKNGICRYVSNYYSTYYNTNAMFGFVVENIDIMDNISKINSLLRKSYTNQQGKKVKANVIQEMQYNNFAGAYPYSFISKHKHTSKKEIVLYHLMFDFSNIIV